MKKKFDAVKMVREIRDKLSRKTKNMSRKELIEFYHQAAVRVHAGARNGSKAHAS